MSLANPLAVMPAPGNAGFTPQSISGLQVWYDAQYVHGVADGTQMTFWPDRSGHNVNALTSATLGDTIPTYYSTTSAQLFNGHPCWQFDGNRNIMVIPVPATWATGALIVVGAATYTTNTVVPFLYDGGGWSIGYWLYSGPLYEADAGNNGGTGALEYNMGNLPTRNRFFATILNGVNSFLFLDGSTVSTGNAGSISEPGGNNFCIGSVSEGAGYRLQGPIAEILVYSPPPTPSQISQLHTYEASKWGVP